LLVLFEEKLPGRPADENIGREPGEKIEDPTVHQLEQELQSTREYLQATIEELETTNEELKSNNEEMQSVNEELQSTNEELETSKEELQSTNEELATVNSELQNKVTELSKASDDMNNVLAASEIASIFMDTRLNINRYTPAAARIIKLIPTDIGRPLSDLKTSFPGIDLAGHAKKVLKDLNTLETEILSEDRIWHALKVLPYRTSDNVIAGVVMTVVDIHRVKQADKIRRLATVLEDANDAIMVQDFKGRILAWNKGAEEMYGWTEFEALKMNIKDLIPKERLKEEKAFLDKLKKGEAVKAFKTRRMTKDGKLLDIWLNATVLTAESGQPIEIATTERNLAWLPTD
jgi:two-component system CheB/CheR fusion protein